MKTLSIIIVEDDMLTANYLNNILINIGHDRTEIFFSAEDAINKLSILNKKPDIIFMDINLNGDLNGIEATNIINNKFNIPLIYTSATESMSIINEAIKTKPYGYLIKPYSAEQIKISIDIALSRYKIEQDQQKRQFKLEELNKTLAYKSQKLKESEEALIQAQKLANIGSWKFELKTKKYTFSDEVYRILGLETTDKITNLRKKKLIHKDDQDLFILKNKQIIEKNRKRRFDYRIITNDGTLKYIEQIGHPVKNANDEIYEIYGTIMDITEHKKAELVLIKALKKEKELNALKSGFVSITSHQFRTPLTTIQTCIDLIHLLCETQKCKHYSEIITQTQLINGEIKRLEYLMSDILMLGKIEARKIPFSPVKTNFVKLCKNIIYNQKFQHQEDRIVEFSVKGTPVDINIDHKLIENVLSNLISNAFKYSCENPKFTIKYKPTKISFSVSDKGIGIPRKEQKHIFKSFYRASNVENLKGTGLGLLISKQFVEMNNGKLSFKSKLNKGSKFTVKIPIDKGKVKS